MSVIASRLHLGDGELALNRDLSVFVNCPFDADFEARFDAIVFATICCGFMPRCAIESAATSEPRMARITKAVQGSKYSIHDLSRCRGEGKENLARFNMPLELGIAMGERFRSADTGETHDWLVLVL
jgi:hypothetical protein